MPFNMLFNSTKCLRGNIAHEEFSNDIVGDQRPNGWPTPREIVHNTDVHQPSIHFQKPGHFHPSTDATHMSKIDVIVYRVKALASCPAYWKAITMCCHLHQTLGHISREHVDPTIVRQQTWPLLNSASHSVNLVDVATYRDAVLRVHILLSSPDPLQFSREIKAHFSYSPGEERTRYGDRASTCTGETFLRPSYRPYSLS